MYRWLPVLLFTLCTFLSACETGPETVPEHYSLDSITPAYLQEKLRQRQGRIHDLRAYVKTYISTPRQNQTLKQVMLMNGRDRLRLDTLSPFNQPLTIFIMKGEVTRLFDLKKNRLYQGLEVWNMMHELLGTVIDFNEYVPVFYGDIPRFDHVHWDSAQLNEDKTQYVMTGQDAEHRVTLQVRMNAETLLPESMLKWVGNRPLYSVAWGDYKDLEGYPFPHQVTVVRAAQKDQVNLVYSNIIANQGVSEETFSPNLPGLTPSSKVPSS